MQYSVVNCRKRKINRLQNYDYSQNGYYFVTICEKNRKEFFGEITNDEMILNECGRIIDGQWLWLKDQYDYVKLDEYIVMPNHIHGILIIENKNVNGRDRSRPVPTKKIKSLSELMGAFKTTSSKLIHQTGLKNFIWQRSFYDHIIRNNQSLNNIRAYVKNNPIKWAMDRNNQENLYY